MKKFTIFIIILTIILAGVWGLLRFQPQFLPQKFLSDAPTSVKISSPDEAAVLYQEWRDSIDALDVLIRNESQAHLIQIHKEQQAYLWKKIQDARQVLAEPPVSTEYTLSAQGLAQLLSKVLAITAAILILFIFVLLGLLKRKKTLLTRQLNTIQQEDRFKEPKGGFLNEDWTNPESFDPQSSVDFSPPQGFKPSNTTEIRSPNALDDDETSSSTDASPKVKVAPQATKTQVPKGYSRPSPNHIRPTARHKVTKALKGLAEALSTLKEEPKTKVRSPNSDFKDPNPTKSVLQPSRFDKEKEIKEEIIKLARRGFTSSEIARRLRISQDQVETIIRLQRDAGL